MNPLSLSLRMNCYCLMWVLFLLVFTNNFGSSFIITDNFFANPPSLKTGRSLLQLEKPCPFNVEAWDYTNITSQCKVPYNVSRCCGAFKAMACPYASYMDETTDCMEKLLNYLRLKGTPAGLFNSLCRDGKDVLECPTPSPPPSSLNVNANGFQTPSAPCLLAGITFIFFWIF